MRRPNPGERSSLPAYLLALLASLLFVNQHQTLPKLRDFVIAQTDAAPIGSIQSRALSLLLGNVVELLSPLDWFLIASLFLVAAALVLVEWHGRGLTLFVEELAGSPWALYLFLGLAGLIVTRSYMSAGNLFMGDTEAHTLRSFMVSEHLREGRLPAWSNYWYGGYPLVGFYGPLYFVVTALLAIPLGDIQLATKVLLWATHIASMFVMFSYLFEASESRHGALVGALAYGYSFHRLHIILYRGDLQLSLVFLIYPYLLWVIERFLKDGRRPKRTFVSFGLGLFLLIINHHGYAFFGMVFLSVYLLLRITLMPASHVLRLRLLALFALSGVFGLLCGVFSLVPFMAETEYVRGLGGSPWVILLPNLRAPLVLIQMFQWSPVAGDRNIGYLGLSIAALAAVSGLYVFRRRVIPGIALSACAVCSLLMMRNFVDYNVKNTNFFLVFVAALCAFAPAAVAEMAKTRPRLARLAQSQGRFWPATLTLAALALLAVDLGPLTFHSVYRPDDGFKDRLYDRIIALEAPHKVMERRVLRYVPDGDQRQFFEPGNIGVANAHKRIQTPLGRFHEGAGLSFGYNVEMVKNVNRDLHESRFSDESLQGLYLLGVKYVLFRDRTRFFRPRLVPSDRYRFEDQILLLRDASPLVASTRMISHDEVPGFEPDNIIDNRQYFDPQTYSYEDGNYLSIVAPLLQAMRVDPARGTARTLVSRDPTRVGMEAAGGAGEDVDIDLVDFDVGIERIRIAYRASANGFVRLSYAYFPYLDVRVDGAPAEFWPSAMHQILMPLEEGEHVITIRGGPSPLRVQTFWFSLVVLLGGLLLPSRALAVFRHDRA